MLRQNTFLCIHVHYYQMKRLIILFTNVAICWCKSDAALKKKKIRTEDLNSVFFYDKIFDILLKLLEELGIQFLSTCILT